VYLPLLPNLGNIFINMPPPMLTSKIPTETRSLLWLLEMNYLLPCLFNQLFVDRYYVLCTTNFVFEST